MGVMETEERKGKPDMATEISRALTGKDGGPVHPDAALNVGLLQKVCFIPFRRQSHEQKAMLEEIGRQMRTADVLERAAEPEPELELEPEPEPESVSVHEQESGVPVAVVAAHLQSMSIDPKRSVDLATALVDEGYDEAELIEEIEEEQLKALGFKDGDLKKVSRFKNNKFETLGKLKTRAHPLHKNVQHQLEVSQPPRLPDVQLDSVVEVDPTPLAAAPSAEEGVPPTSTGTSSLSDDGDTSHSDIDGWLDELGLSKYSGAVKEYGYEQLSILLAATEGDVLEMTEDGDVGMKKPARRAFLNGWEKLMAAPAE